MPAGLYAIVTICNVNPINFEFDPKLFGAQVVLVNGVTTGSSFDTGSLAGSSAGSGGSATGSGASD
ncbi:hypothetical protein G4X40_09755 [Rhodococcus sp. D2-41]|uniref:Uncharacterized protein n=1 Tax=Speluncibacter jeojiensis TaxID=2710754 RepID=A0A9X4LZQ3_9ACTN|nr:hypothetical protein [Rhodococcus sp. D2-41]MDG3010430.1 hypothetical protein [Rhodococcus sp. D2-41]MDG3014177.1 hypothetical protein [Corynebacteriales bacterium D3-21]